MGLSEWAYWMSWLVFYAPGVLFIGLSCAALLTWEVLREAQFLPVALLLSVLGLSLFGYVVFMQSLF